MENKNYLKHREKRIEYQKRYYHENKATIRKKQNLYWYIYYYYGPHKNIKKSSVQPRSKTVESILVTF